MCTIKKTILGLWMAVSFAYPSMLLEYKFDGSGSNTGTTGSPNDLVLVGSTGSTPTFGGSGSPYDSSGLSYDSSSLSYGTAMKYYQGGSLSLANNTSFTITGWINSTGAQSAGTRLFDKAASASGGLTLYLATNKLTLNLGNGTTQGSGSSVGYNYATLNTWLWFGVTYNATTGDASFYNMNASNQVTLLNTANLGVTGYKNTTASLTMLNVSGGTRAFVGQADQIRFFDDIQSVSQMQSLAAVPEPKVFALLGWGMIIMARRMKRLR